MGVRRVAWPQCGQGMLSPAALAINSRWPPQDWHKPLEKSFGSISTRRRGGGGAGSAGGRCSTVSVCSGVATGFGAVVVGGTAECGMTGGSRIEGMETGTFAGGCASGGVSLLGTAGLATPASCLAAAGCGRLSRCSRTLSCVDNRASSCASRVCCCFSRSNSDRSCSFMIVSSWRLRASAVDSSRGPGRLPPSLRGEPVRYGRDLDDRLRGYLTAVLPILADHPDLCRG